MTRIDDRLDAVHRIAKILDEFGDHEDIEAVLASVEELVADLGEEDDGDDDGGGTPLDVDEDEPCLKVVGE